LTIVRFLNADGQVEFGERVGPRSAKRWIGDLLTGYEVTDEIVDIAEWLVPIVPTDIICIGLNYRKHALESGVTKMPEYPIVFYKSKNALLPHEVSIEIPRYLASDSVDFECELAVVIGRTGKNIPRERALDYVLGYTAANDVSARDWQLQRGGKQWGRAKSFDTFCPLGPGIVTKDEIPNPNSLGIRTILNEEAVQECNTEDMIFDVPTLIEFLSGSTTLLAGTVILTGTPHGVGMGRTPPIWLKSGDTVIVEIDGIGQLVNDVKEERLP